MTSPELPDAFFDFALFCMRLPSDFNKISSGGFQLSSQPSIQIKQQISHECFHVLQSLQYPFFGNFTNYLWKRSKAIYEEIEKAEHNLNFRFGEGLPSFSKRNGASGLKIWSAVVVQDRYDESQFSEYHQKHPTSLFSLVESMAVSFQAISTSALPEVAFPELPSSYTRTHDFIAGYSGAEFDLLDHYLFLASVDPVLRATDFGSKDRMDHVKKLANSWSRLKDIYQHMKHISIDCEEYIEFILELCDDYVLPRWEVDEVKRRVMQMDVDEVSIAAAAMSVGVVVNEEILNKRNSVPSRVHFTPLSERVASRISKLGWGRALDFDIPLLLSSSKIRDQVFGEVLSGTINPISRNNDIAFLGDFVLRAIESRDGVDLSRCFVNCNEHGEEDWREALKCSSIHGISACLDRLGLASVEEIFLV